MALRIAVLLVVLVAGCTKEQRVAPPPPPAAPAALKAIAAWEPVDDAFKGCAGACGTLGEDAAARVQPGAVVGGKAYCPVSGVVFTVQAATPKADVGGKPVYFCCDSCAAHFNANRSKVLAARKL